jgi:hypothetical protein
MSSGISPAFAGLFRIRGWIAHALLTRAPLYSPDRSRDFSCDLHVLSTPPAFILSQDQTLQLKRAAGLPAVELSGLACFRRCPVFKDRTPGLPAPRPDNPTSISHRRVPVKLFFRGPLPSGTAPEDRSPEEPDQSIRIPISRQALFSPPALFSRPPRRPVAGSRARRTSARPRRSGSTRAPPRLPEKKTGRLPRRPPGLPPASAASLRPTLARHSERTGRPGEKKTKPVPAETRTIYTGTRPSCQTLFRRDTLFFPENRRPKPSVESFPTFIYPATR